MLSASLSWSVSVHYNMKLVNPRNIFILIMCICVVSAVIAIVLDTAAVQTESGAEASHTLVIDPGHGGIDGGAISTDGTKESDINLAIALKLRALAEFMGQATVMTREDDSWRTDAASYSEHEDLVHRTEIINAAPNAILFSIHQNCFPTAQPSGAQVLYAKYEGSELLGTLTHHNLISCLDPENRRVAEPASEKLYITANVKCPAILVECGFMSNNYDVLKLKDDSYQLSLALVLMCSFLQFTSGTAQA